MKTNKNELNFLGYSWTTKEFAGLFLLESFTNELSLSLEEYAPNSTTKEVALEFMGEERFMNLVNDGYIENLNGSDNFIPTAKLYQHSNEFLSCIVKWHSLVEIQMNNSSNS